MLSVFAAAQDVVGQISSSRAAKYSTAPTSPNAQYLDIAANQKVRNGNGVRTARRGFANIAFNDKSVLRLSELTELIVQDSTTLRRLQLAKGALWVRVTKGSNTSIQTPVATATVRGTEFLFDEFGNLAVREGMVELEAGGFTIEVLAGEIAGVGPDGKPYKKGLHIPTEESTDAFQSGVPELWWRRLKGDPDPLSTDLSPLVAWLPLLFIDGGNQGRPASVPEPATILLLSTGFFVAYRRQKSMKK